MNLQLHCYGLFTSFLASGRANSNPDARNNVPNGRTSLPGAKKSKCNRKVVLGLVLLGLGGGCTLYVKGSLISRRLLLTPKSVPFLIRPKSMHIEIRSALIAHETAQSFQPTVNGLTVTMNACVIKALRSMRILVGIETSAGTFLMSVKS